MKSQSIYIHIPFCKTKCPYCDFASWANKEHLMDEYFKALVYEIKTKCEAYNAFNVVVETSACPSLQTIFIGGGTPSLVPPEYYENIFAEIKKNFEIAKDCEITLELNPGTAKKDFLEGYKQLGINRISIGAQSFDENILNVLGRKHSLDETIFAIELIKEVGFENFNLDLIYAVPDITLEIWESTVYKALEYNPHHISAYSLIIEEGTPFEKIYRDSSLLPSDDFSFQLYLMLCNILKSKGYVHYEVSNFAKPRFESKHNLNCWLGKEYFAFGLGAHRFLNGLRTCNLRGWEEYIKTPNLEQIIDFKRDDGFEKVMLNSRLKSGMNVSLLKKVSTKSSSEMLKLLNDLSNEGYVELLGDRIHLTDKGMFVNNEILLKLV